MEGKAPETRKQLSFDRKPRFLGRSSTTKDSELSDLKERDPKEKDKHENKNPSSPSLLSSSSASSPPDRSRDPRKIPETRSLSPRSGAVGKGEGEGKGKKSFRESGEIFHGVGGGSSFWSEKLSTSRQKSKTLDDDAKENKIRVEFVVDPLNPPLRLGYLTIKTAGHRWRRRWCALDSNSLHIYKETMQSVSKIPLLGGAVKPVPDKHTNFVLLTCGDTFQFLCDSPKEMFSWVTSIGDVCENLVMNSIQSEKKNEKKETEEEGGESKEREELIALMKVPGNNVCADCNAPDPDWASINLGVFICLQCSGVHRSLGSHVSKVRSIHLDDWLPETVEVMRSIGNSEANQMWENQLPGAEAKPAVGSTREEREKYIGKKYVKKAFRERAGKEGEGAGLQEEELKYMFLDLLQRDTQFRKQVRALLMADENTHSPFPTSPNLTLQPPSPCPSPPNPSSPLSSRFRPPSPTSPSRPLMMTSPFRPSSPNSVSSSSSSSGNTSPPPNSPLSTKSSSLPPPKKPLRLSPPPSTFSSSVV